MTGGASAPRADASARERWNARYRSEGAEVFGREPSEWLVAQRGLLEARPKGRALDLACGGGRNAFFLAELGFDVDAVDVSDVALAGLRAAARERGLAIATVQRDLETDGFPDASYEVIVDFNFLLRSLFAPIVRALAPGGVFVMETWRHDPGRRRPSLQPGELLAAVAELDVVAHAERESGEQLREAVVARKPG